jgi:hypothetical protein
MLVANARRHQRRGNTATRPNATLADVSKTRALDRMTAGRLRKCRFFQE